LAVSGALLAGIVFAVSGSINVQRYRDSTESCKSLLQQQYSEVDNVQNPQAANRTCNSQAMVTRGGSTRGRSGCIVIGKYLTITDGTIAIHKVLAYEVSAPTAGANDITAMQNNYRINIVKTGIETKSLQWNANIAWATAGNAF